jgi:hypothetical protein
MCRANSSHLCLEPVGPVSPPFGVRKAAVHQVQAAVGKRHPNRFSSAPDVKVPGLAIESGGINLYVVGSGRIRTLAWAVAS